MSAFKIYSKKLFILFQSLQNHLLQLPLSENITFRWFFGRPPYANSAHIKRIKVSLCDTNYPLLYASVSYVDGLRRNNNKHKINN